MTPFDDDFGASHEELLASGIPAFLIDAIATVEKANETPASADDDRAASEGGDTAQADALPTNGHQNDIDEMNANFDYGVLGDNAATTVRAAMEAIDDHLNRIRHSAIEVGLHLIAIHETMTRKQWGQWVQVEYVAKRGQVRRSAEYRMQVARAFGDRADEVTDLPFRVLIALADVPRDVQDMVIAAHRNRMRITTAIAERIKHGEPVASVLGLAPPPATPQPVEGPALVAEVEAGGSDEPAPVADAEMPAGEQDGDEEEMPAPAAEADAAGAGGLNSVDFNKDGLPNFDRNGYATVAPIGTGLKRSVPQAHDDKGYELLKVMKAPPTVEVAGRDLEDDNEDSNETVSLDDLDGDVQHDADDELAPFIPEPVPVSTSAPARSSEGLAMVMRMAERDLPVLIGNVEDLLGYLETICTNGRQAKQCGKTVIVTKADSERVGREAERLVEELWRLTRRRPTAWLRQRRGVVAEALSGPWGYIGDGLHRLHIHWHDIKEFSHKPDLNVLIKARDLLRQGLTAESEGEE